MKFCLDTNIFIKSLIEPRFRDICDKFIDSEDGILPLTVWQEIQNKLLFCFVFMRELRDQISNAIEDNLIILLRENKRYDTLKLELPEIENFVNYLANQRKLGLGMIDDYLSKKCDFITTILSIIDKNKKYFPLDTEGEKKAILSQNIAETILKKVIADFSDIKHLLICQAYATQAKDNVLFFTKDWKHILSNKVDIESALDKVKVFDSERFESETTL